jgi:hypothetical protein
MVHAGGSEEGTCDREDVTDYDTALHIGAIFIVLFVSFIGASLPVRLNRRRFTQPP